MTDEFSWHVQNCDLIGSLEPKWELREIPQDSIMSPQNLV